MFRVHVFSELILEFFCEDITHSLYGSAHLSLNISLLLLLTINMN